MTQKKSVKLSFQERLLRIMDAKDHALYWKLMSPEASRDNLRTHYLQEWSVYVKDFPVFLARILGKNPPADVRRDLAENIFEEETGKLTLGVAHPELFLRMMEGLKISRQDFTNVKLKPKAKAYRAWLDQVTTKGDWITAAAVITIFVEGSRKDREEVEGTKSAEDPVEDKLKTHPLVVHHGLDPKFLDLQRAHHQAESGHRAAAWHMVMTYAKTAKDQKNVEAALKKSIKLWKAYRDEVAKTTRLL
jgi:pyrroloquinoline quinone (PQQ) biosynthesis protein C